jgi:tRNA threonylcarbamoyladenosine biosynthesis protein TsaE
MKQVSDSLDKTSLIAKQFLTSLKQGNKAVVVALFGDLGAGKTAFVKKCAEHLGIKDTIISPTFVIEKIYKLPKEKNNIWQHLVHIDAYRFENFSEMKHLGFDELVNNKRNLIFVEWPERIIGALPEERENVYFTFIDEDTREIDIRKDGKNK